MAIVEDRDGVEPLTDDELTELALAADPDAPLDDDAEPFDQVDGGGGLLPGWYMPSPMAGARRLEGWRRRVAWLIVVAFLAIFAAGLCSTYGFVEIA